MACISRLLAVIKIPFGIMSEPNAPSPLVTHLKDAGIDPVVLKKCLAEFVAKPEYQYDYEWENFFEVYLLTNAIYEFEGLL